MLHQIIKKYIDHFWVHDGALYSPITDDGWTVDFVERPEIKFTDPDFRLFIVLQDMLTFKPNATLPNELITIHNYYKDRGIDMKQVVAVVWNHGVADIWHKANPDSIQVVEFSPWQYNTALDYKNCWSQIQRVADKHEPNYVAVAPNRIAKRHRVDTYNDLKSNPLMNVSLQQRGIELKYPGKTFEGYDYNNAENLLSIGKNYQDAWLAVICESQYYEHRGIITEKTYNAIVSMTPFIMVGSQFLLEHLENQGFKTFNALGGRWYDTLENTKRREAALTYLPTNLRYAEEVYYMSYDVLTWNYQWFLHGYTDFLVKQLKSQLNKLN